MSDNQNKEPHKMPSTGLDESPLSAYAKAIREIHSKKNTYILMGWTPPLLGTLTNIGKLATNTHYSVLRKAMLGQGKNKHYVPEKIMLQVPYACNNAVGILKSSPDADKKGFVFITDLQVKGKPVIVPMHKVVLPTGNIALFMPTTFDKKIKDFQRLLDYDVLCWDYSKAERFEQIYSGILDLPPHIYPTADFGKQQRAVFRSDTELDSATPANQVVQAALSLSQDTRPLFVDYDKTERYLSQYFSDLSVNPNLYLDAEKVQKVREWTRENAPLTPKEAQTQMMSVYAEFIPENSEAYKDTEKRVEQQITEHYKQGKVLTPQDIQQVRENFTQKMPQVRQDFHQAAAKQQTQSTLPENITQQNQDDSIKNTTQNNSDCLKR
ncbi:MAG: hypothetical protein J5680_00005 [Neisseriaceae bacterium]|nr:hypothetical protein [Neisseriaceae bacterium]